MKRNESKSATREKILAIAESIFIDSDFNASTLAIARKAGIAHGTLFFHFQNRDELILAVVRRLVLRITDTLYDKYVHANTLDGFLKDHREVMQTNWPLIRALFSGFIRFNDDVKHEVVALLSVVNYYLTEAFHQWSDNALARTVLWQGMLIYLACFGDYMFDMQRLSETFFKKLDMFMKSPLVTREGSHAKQSALEKKHCISCGMILSATEDFARSDPTETYCRYCTREDGTLRSFDEVLDILVTFFQRTQVLNPEASHRAAFTVLAKNPAWKEYVKKFY